MKIGIGLPGTIPGAQGETVLEWARKADQGPFPALASSIAWSGEAPGDGAGPVGPRPSQHGGPELLIGARSPPGLARAGGWAEGILVPGTPDSIGQAYAVAQDSWKAAGRAGAPRLVGAAYYALGPGSQDRGAAYVRDYYGCMGAGTEYLAQSILGTAETVRNAIEVFSGIGMDEFILWPTISELDQVDRLADIVS